MGIKELKRDFKPLAYYRKDKDGINIPRSQQVHKGAEFLEQVIWKGNSEGELGQGDITSSDPPKYETQWRDMGKPRQELGPLEDLQLGPMKKQGLGRICIFLVKKHKVYSTVLFVLQMFNF